MNHSDLYKKHKNSAGNKDFNHALKQNIKHKQQYTLTDQKFESLWERAISKHKSLKRNSWLYAASAAVLALLISLAVIKTMQHTDKQLKQQYQQATLALYQVSYQLNRNINRLSPIEEIIKSARYIEPIEKPIAELQKLEPVKRIPFKD